MSNTEPCYEYFNCKALDCSRRNQPALHCWEVDDSQCKTHSEEFDVLKKRLGNKQAACKFCIYYQRQQNQR